MKMGWEVWGLQEETSVQGASRNKIMVSYTPGGGGVVEACLGKMPQCLSLLC